MVLNGKGILAEILNQHLVLNFIIALAHLEHHILIWFYFVRLGFVLYLVSLDINSFLRLIDVFSLITWLKRFIGFLLLSFWLLMLYLSGDKLVIGVSMTAIIWTGLSRYDRWLVLLLLCLVLRLLRLLTVSVCTLLKVFDFFCLVTISEPIMKVVPKLFQYVHIVSVLTICFGCI